VEIVADKGRRFKIAGQSKPEITLKAGEQLYCDHGTKPKPGTVMVPFMDLRCCGQQ